MDPELLIQAIINGVLLGGVYALMATGLSLIFGVMRVINFAHGEMMVLGMYVAFLCKSLLGADPFVAWPVAALVLFFLGVFIQRYVINRILDAPHEIQLLLMLGLALVLQNTFLVLFGPAPKSVGSFMSLWTVWLGPWFIDMPRLITFGLAVVVTGLLFVFLQYSRMGREIRAASDNPYGAKVIGLDSRFIYAVAFGIGAACVGISGTLVASFVNFDPSMGFVLGVTSFYVVIIGGMGNIPGAFLGGLVVAIGESLGAVLLSPSLKQLVSFSLFIVILLFRPAGLLGRGRL
ncbi:MAG: branched-chain amino acid ABC transporter permease [Reyranellaceae bacterium]